MPGAIDRLYRTYRGLREVGRYAGLHPLRIHYHRRSGAALRRITGAPAISYTTFRYPLAPATRSEVALGGAAKLTYLTEAWPHTHPGCNVLYVVNSVFSRSLLEVVRAARRQGIQIVLNQNGVCHPALYEFNWRRANAILSELHSSASYVIYQSRFSKLSAERYLSATGAPWTILHNPVDTSHFSPGAGRMPADAEPVLLAIASRTNRYYRVKIALETLAVLRARMPRARLIVPGYDSTRFGDRQALQSIRRDACALGIPSGAIELPPAFTKQHVPEIFRRAHVLLHLSHHDPCPSVVAEAMACGCPVVCLGNGGTPELVGDRAGIVIPSELNWEKIVLPEPSQVAEAVTRILERWEEFSVGAVRQARDKCSLEDFLSRHRTIFEKLL
jgi:glycosyltransferase involved in cell wall biosynthesis